jgi:uncharacterized protein
MSTVGEIRQGPRIALYVGLALGFEWILGLLGKRHLGGGSLVLAAGMFTPALAVLVTWLALGRQKIQLGLSRAPRGGDLATAFLFDPVLYGVAHLLAVALGVAQPRYLELIGHLPMGLDKLRLGLTGWPSLVPVLLGAVVVGVIVNSVFAFGEEIGWRGYLQRQLGFLPPVRATLILGLVWAVWHVPAFVLYGYSFPTMKTLGFLLFSASVIAESMVFAVLVFRSGSMWPAVVLHAMHNLTSQALCPLIFRGTWHPELLLGEDGLLPTALHVLAGSYLAVSGKVRRAFEQFRARA